MLVPGAGFPPLRISVFNCDSRLEDQITAEKSENNELSRKLTDIEGDCERAYAELDALKSAHGQAELSGALQYPCSFTTLLYRSGS